MDLKRVVILSVVLAFAVGAAAQSGNFKVPLPQQKKPASTEAKVEVRYNTPVTFTFCDDCYKPDNNGKRKIKAVADFISSHTGVTEVWVGCFATYEGSDAYLMKRTEKQAETIRDILIEQGVDKDIITTSGKGKAFWIGSKADGALDAAMIIVCNGKREALEIMSDFFESFENEKRPRF